MPEEVKVHTNVAPSLHPQNIATIEGYNDQTRAYVAEVETAFSTAYEAINNVHTAREVVKKNPTLTEAAQVLRVADHAYKLQQNALAKMDSARTNLKKAIDANEGMLTTPLENASGTGTINEEVRRHVKALTPAERMQFMQDASARGDERTLVAVLGAPSYLSGLSPEMQALFTRQYHERKHPETAARLKVMQTAYDMLNKRSGLVMGEIEKAIGTDWRKVQRLREATAESEKAFILSSKL